VAKIIIFEKNKMAASAILDFGKIAITSPRTEGFGSIKFCMWYKITHKIRSCGQNIHLTQLLDGGRHLGFGKTAITSPKIDVFR